MKICCLGDSLTEGDYGVFGKRGIANVQKENYPYFLEMLTGAEVRNYGRCGYKATEYLKYYQSGAVDIHGADLIVIMLGTNGGHDPGQDTPANAAYREIVKLCRRDAPGAKIYLCTPPHATENPEMSNYGHAERVKAAGAFVRKLAAEENLPLIEVAQCGDFTSETESVMQANDGLHFTRLGYERLANFIYQSIRDVVVPNG